MNRVTLLDVLSAVGRGLSTKDFIEILVCLCFDGKTVTANDDLVVMQAPCDLPIKGGVRGKVLLDWLAASKAKDVKVTQEKEAEIIVEAGRTKLKMAVMPEDTFLHPDSLSIKGTKIAKAGPLADAIRRALVTIGLDPAQEERLGVTVDMGSKQTVVYSSDNLTATRVVLPIKVEDKGALQLSPRFCDLLTDHGSRDSLVKIRYNADGALAEFGSGTLLYGKVCGPGATDDYAAFFKTVSESKPSALPRGFARAIERAMVVWLAPHSEKETDKHNTRLTIKRGKLRMVTESPLGRVEDVLKVDHADAELIIAPGLVQRCLAGADRFVLSSEQCILLEGEGFTHAITNGG